MKTTVEFLDAVKARHGLTSDYALARLLGVVPSAIYGYRAGRSHLDEGICLTVAKALDVAPGYVLACVAAERAKRTEVARAWRELAKQAAGVAALVLVAVSGLPYLPDVVAETAAFNWTDLYIMRSKVTSLQLP